MHNNVLALHWEHRKRREDEDKEAKVSRARQHSRFLGFRS